MVFNPSPTDFIVTAGGVSGPALFLFAEDGTISGWNPIVNLHRAVRVVDNFRLGSVYKGLAIALTGQGWLLYATNFHDGTVEVYDTNFQLVNVFSDIPRPAGYAPFGIRNFKGKLYVTFAVQDQDKHDDVAGPGYGLVEEFGARPADQTFDQPRLFELALGIVAGRAELWKIRERSAGREFWERTHQCL
jgi:uncharacterized protein (TIGR03118 family)